MKFLSLTQGKFAIIDDEDFEKVGHFKWQAQKQRSGNFYAGRIVGKRPTRTRIYLHCELMGATGVDHKNGNGLDCRRSENLRFATPQQNNQARRRKIIGSSSKFRGVYWFIRDQRWRAQIRMGNRYFFLGSFQTEETAARAYDAKAIELGFFKEALNFPNL